MPNIEKGPESGVPEEKLEITKEDKKEFVLLAKKIKAIAESLGKKNFEGMDIEDWKTIEAEMGESMRRFEELGDKLEKYISQKKEGKE